MALDTEHWYHIAFSFDGTTMRFYLDGTEVGAESFALAADTTTREVFIGGYSTSGTDIDGHLRDVRLVGSRADRGADRRQPADGADRGRIRVARRLAVG